MWSDSNLCTVGTRLVYYKTAYKQYTIVEVTNIYDGHVMEEKGDGWRVLFDRVGSVGDSDTVTQLVSWL